MQQGISFILIAADTLGRWQKEAIEQFKKLGAVLAGHRGEDEQLAVCHLRQRLSLIRMRGNACLMVNRIPDSDTVDAMVDGVE